MTIAKETARRINALEFREFPADAIAWAKLAIQTHFSRYFHRAVDSLGLRWGGSWT